MRVAVSAGLIMTQRERFGPGDPGEQFGKLRSLLDAHAQPPSSSRHAAWIASISNR